MAYNITTEFFAEYNVNNDTLTVSRKIFDEAGNEFNDLYVATPIGFENQYYGEITFYNSGIIHEPLSVTIQAYYSKWRNERRKLAVVIAEFFRDSSNQPGETGPSHMSLLLKVLPE